MRKALYVTLSIIAAFSARAEACSFATPPIAEIVSGVAANGMLIRGHVIQAFDANARQSEIIRADEIFIGEGGPTDFEIYRPDSAFGPPVVSPERGVLAPCSTDSFSEEWQTFDRLVLMPANSSRDSTAEGKWSIYFWASWVDRGRALERLAREADQLGRFQAFPPKSPRFSD